MEPIISPWLIYLISRCDTVISFLCGALVTIGAVAGVVLIFTGGLSATSIDDDDKQPLRAALPYIKKSAVVFLILSVLYLIVPSKNTLICMIVADNITEDRVSFVADEAGETVDSVRETIKEDIIDIIRATKEESE